MPQRILEVPVKVDTTKQQTGAGLLKHLTQIEKRTLSYAQRKNVPMYQKSDNYDAEAVALVLINMRDRLPDAIPDDKYWTLSQLVNRRDNINVHQQRLKNQLHEQLCMAYPSYKKFFEDIGRPTALYFFGEYPSPVHLRGKTAEELAGELRPVSHNNCSVKKAEKILELVKADGETLRDCQESRDIITRGLVRDLQYYREQMLEVEEAIKDILPYFPCTLMTMPGIDIVTAANMLSEIGNIERFPKCQQAGKIHWDCPSKLFISRKRQGYVPETGKQAFTGHILFSGDSDGAGIAQRNGETSGIPGIFPEETG